jgi:hypothetical protein
MIAFRRGRWLFRSVAGIATVLLIAALYVLSIGPAYWLMCRGWLDPGVYQFVYQPIYYFYRFPLFEEIVEWYALSRVGGKDPGFRRPP